jgi:hypothetical protein
MCSIRVLSVSARRLNDRLPRAILDVPEFSAQT